MIAALMGFGLAILIIIFYGKGGKKRIDISSSDQHDRHVTKPEDE